MRQHRRCDAGREPAAVPRVRFEWRSAWLCQVSANQSATPSSIGMRNCRYHGVLVLNRCDVKCDGIDPNRTHVRTFPLAYCL